MADCLPFNAIEHDRAYKAEDWAWYFATFIGNGVFPKPSDGLKVMAYDKMTVKVSMGYAFINGYAYRNPVSQNIVLNMAEGDANRIDRVVIRWDLSKRDIYLNVLEGVPSMKPIAKTITRGVEIWELAIADIYVRKGTTEIQNRDITDLRYDKEVCGIVKGTVEEIDVSTITKQFEDFVERYKQEKTLEYEVWLNNVKETLETIENGKMLIEINELLKELYRMATDDDIDKIIGGTYVDEDNEGKIFETGSNQDIDDIIAGTYTDTEGQETDPIEPETNIEEEEA